MSKARKITLGTKEWADSNVNCYSGCSNNCKYCYAKKMAIRFNRKTNESWNEMVPNQKAIEKGYMKRKGRVMFPSSHDITEESLDNCLVVLEKLFKSGNNVLITTKPRFECIQVICKKFIKYKNLLQFRFTITSINNGLLEFWEPNAPLFEERLKSLKYAYEKGFKTSVSIEPFLDKNPFTLVEKLLPYITESIWVGKMNYMSSSNINVNDKKYYYSIYEINSNKNLLEITKKALKFGKIIRLKDSIFNSLGLNKLKRN
ncbi:MAG: hypothetical protein EU529_00730 [Promethearchaeota archaeon]|nr:MAG: hypothetical protein EU529_00730 [Candidatus Lokiarchaeota archaeon]